MKKLLVSLLIGAFLFTGGCATWEQYKAGELTMSQEEMVEYGVETAAIPIGYYAAKNDNIDLAFREIYALGVTGTLTPESINRILIALKATKDPFALLMIKRVLRLAEKAGATLSPDGKTIVSLAGVKPGFVEAIRYGYLEGYTTYKITHTEVSN